MWFALTLLAGGPITAFAGPKLLLTPQRLHRLQRDRDRQTDRWMDFAGRVQSVTDSEERGFELALSAVVSGDGTQAQGAITWGLQHPCAIRQVALIANWVGESATEEQRKTLTAFAGCPESPNLAERARDELFASVARHDEPQGKAPEFGDLQQAGEVYAAAEYREAFRNTQSEALEEGGLQFWDRLPLAYLLSFRPSDLEHPSWEAHIAALALVSLHPDAQGSQFLQGWATEDRFRLRTGPGVAYELLWADPYLPGIGYQNMDPWLYVENPPHLLARTSWTPDACWMNWSAGSKLSANCAGAAAGSAIPFGTMEWRPLPQGCADLERPARNHTVLLHTAPAARVLYEHGKKKEEARADALGIWKLPEDVSGKVCVKP